MPEREFVCKRRLKREIVPTACPKPHDDLIFENPLQATLTVPGKLPSLVVT